MADTVFGIELETVRGVPYKPLDYNDVYEVLEKFLHLHPDDLEALQMHGPNPRRVDVSTRSIGIWSTRDLFTQINKKFALSSGKNVTICRPYDDYTDIRVKRIPLFWSTEKIKRIFNFYGEVKSIVEERIKAPDTHKDYSGLRNGNYKLKMNLKRAIPSTLIISDHKFEIWYKGQVPSCWRCGKAHRKSDCRTKFDNFVNKFSYDEFPEISNSSNVGNSTEEIPTEEISMSGDEDSTTTEQNQEVTSEANESTVVMLTSDSTVNISTTSESVVVSSMENITSESLTVSNMVVMPTSVSTLTTSTTSESMVVSSTENVIN